jgi:hypothetical protein
MDIRVLHLAGVVAASCAVVLVAAQIPNMRPADQSGITTFEPPKSDSMPFKGQSIHFGAAFTQDFQSLGHQNSATPVVVAGVNTNQLIGIGPGFTTAMANLDMDAQLERGIQVAITVYLSTRHHQDTWVKGGYLQLDASPWDNPTLNALMKYVTVRVGQFETDFGDAHYRRTDAGNGIDNPFVGNLIMDALTTEIGAEVFYRRAGWIVEGGVTGGTSDGEVTSPGKHDLAYVAKVGFDRQLTPELRFRLTGSVYTDAKATDNVLYSGDRAGSHYFDVMENTTSSETTNAWSGDLQPGFSDHVTAYLVNPFIKYGRVEFFGNLETASGATATETSDRIWRQVSGEVVYRFLRKDQAYVAARYNVASGEVIGATSDATIDRVQFAGGLFVTHNILAKVEYVRQSYSGFAATAIRSGGLFSGLMFEGAVGF